MRKIILTSLLLAVTSGCATSAPPSSVQAPAEARPEAVAAQATQPPPPAPLQRSTSGASDSDDFYERLLRRGIDNVDAKNYEAANRELRLAAFGLVNSLEQFQTAHVYLAVTAARVNREGDALQSALRVVAAERIEPRYMGLPVPPQIRAEFDALTAKVLTDQQRTFLRGRPTQQQDAAAAPGLLVAAPEPPQRAAGSTPVTTTAAGPANGAAPATARAASASPKPLTVTELTTALSNADRTLARNDLAAARLQYHRLIDEPALDHKMALRLAEGLYRSRDFAGTLRAFKRVGALEPGEEYFRYYRAVALFETGDVQAARAELAAALPHIELTPDVAAYRTRIENGAVRK